MSPTKTYRVVKPGVTISTPVFQHGGMSWRSIAVPVGELIEVGGTIYSGGHDGINCTAATWNGHRGELGPNSWGSPNMSYLEATQ